ncbi:MAG: alpha/beta hydrolase [Alphaproteobacteria bacterium]
MQNFLFNGTNIKFKLMGEGPLPVFWGHGWGQDHRAFENLAQSFSGAGTHILFDFPGFGGSDTPESVWSTADYADACAALIRTRADKKILWVGHSFGCRVGLQLAARHPDLVAGLFLIAGAGLPRQRPLHQKLYIKAQVMLFKLMKKCLGAERARQKFGSADYKNTSGVLRSIFVKTVNENLSDIAQQITCPVILLYGDRDEETPPEIGERLARLIPDANLVVLEGHDHYSLLAQGRHQSAGHLKRFMERIAS